MLLLAFGSVIAMGLPIVTALLGVGVGMGGVGIFAAFTNVPTVSEMLAVMIGLGVGIDYALFIVTRHRQHLHEGMSPGRRRRPGHGHRRPVGAVRRHHGRASPSAACCSPGSRRSRRWASPSASPSSSRCSSPSRCCRACSAWPAIASTGLSIHRTKAVDEAHQTLSGKWAHHVGRRPWRYAVGSLCVLLARGRARC